MRKISKNSNKTWAVIPARGGSKAIRQKNIRDVCGKPLIYYQIKNAVDSKLIDRVIVATDDPLIAKIAEDIFNDKIEIVMRPPEISHDLSKTEETLIYVLKKLGAGRDVGIIVVLEPTNPLNRTEYVDRCIKNISEEGHDSACCVTDDDGFFLDTPDEMQRLIERPMRQKIKPKTRETGNCWAVKTELLLKENNRLGGKIGFVKIPRYDSYHLDTEEDWRIIESLLIARDIAEGGRYFKTNIMADKENDYGDGYWGVVTDPDGLKRDRTQEREKRIKDCKEEIDYINSLKPGRILDVGCGLGFLLSGVKDDWEKHGVEISSFAAQRAKKYGNIFCGTAGDAKYESDSFDVVMLYHVIEHMKDPVKELKEIRRILKPHGKLIVGTPDFECGLAKRFGNNFRLLHDKGHINLFNTLSLYRILKDLLFETERISFPYFDTEYFTEENLMRLFDKTKVSPPFYGNIVTFYAYKK